VPDLSQYSYKDLLDEKRLAEARIEREQKLIAQLNAHIANQERRNALVETSSPAP